MEVKVSAGFHDEGILYLNEGLIAAMMCARKRPFTGVYAGVPR